MIAQTNRDFAGLGPKAASLLVTLAREGRNVFTTTEAHTLLGGSHAATYKLLHDLIRGGWLHALDKGRYLIVPLEAGPERRFTIHEFRLAHHLAPEGYSPIGRRCTITASPNRYPVTYG